MYNGAQNKHTQLNLVELERIIIRGKVEEAMKLYDYIEKYDIEPRLPSRSGNGKIIKRQMFIAMSIRDAYFDFGIEMIPLNYNNDFKRLKGFLEELLGKKQYNRDHNIDENGPKYKKKESNIIYMDPVEEKKMSGLRTLYSGSPCKILDYARHKDDGWIYKIFYNDNELFVKESELRSDFISKLINYSSYWKEYLNKMNDSNKKDESKSKYANLFNGE